MIDRNVDNTIS